MGIYCSIYCGDIQFDSAKIKPPPCKILHASFCTVLLDHPIPPAFHPFLPYYRFCTYSVLYPPTPPLLPPYIPPTTIYCGCCRQPVRLWRPYCCRNDPLGGSACAGGRVTPLKNIPSQLPAQHAPFMFKLITNFRPCCANHHQPQQCSQLNATFYPLHTVLSIPYLSRTLSNLIIFLFVFASFLTHFCFIYASFLLHF